MDLSEQRIRLGVTEIAHLGVKALARGPPGDLYGPSVMARCHRMSLVDRNSARASPLYSRDARTGSRWV